MPCPLPPGPWTRAVESCWIRHGETGACIVLWPSPVRIGAWTGAVLDTDGVIAFVTTERSYRRALATAQHFASETYGRGA